MTTVKSFEIARVSVEILAGEHTIKGYPWGQSEGPEQSAIATVARVTTPDEFVGFVALERWPGGEIDVRMTDAVGDPGGYGRLMQAGTLAVKQDGDRLVAMLKAMKYGAKGYAKLENVEWEDINGLAGGDAHDMLAGLGASACGDYGDLWQTSAQYRGRPGVEAPSNRPEALIAAYVLTRFVPLLRGYGRAGVEAVD